MAGSKKAEASAAKAEAPKAEAPKAEEPKADSREEQLRAADAFDAQADEFYKAHNGSLREALEKQFAEEDSKKKGKK